MQCILVSVSVIEHGPEQRPAQPPGAPPTATTAATATAHVVPILIYERPTADVDFCSDPEGLAVAAARPHLQPVEGEVLRADGGLPAVLQEGELQDQRDGRIHLQNQAGRGKKSLIWRGQ